MLSHSYIYFIFNVECRWLYYVPYKVGGGPTVRVPETSYSLTMVLSRH